MTTENKSVWPRMWLIFGILTILSLIIFVWGPCQKPPVDPRDALIDSLYQSNAQKNANFNQYADSIGRVIKVKDSAIMRSQGQLSQAKTQVNKTLKVAEYYASRYDSAKAALDTSAQLIYCDSLRWQIATIRESTDTFVAKVGVLVSDLYQKIDLQNGFVYRLKRELDGKDSTITAMYNIQKEIAGENASLKKKLKRAKRSGDAKFILGAGIGAGLRGLFK